MGAPGPFERVIALVRVGVVAAAAGLLLAGADEVASYPALGWLTVIVAAAYAAAMAANPSVVPPLVSTAIDGTLSASLAAATGAGHSPALAILLLVVLAAAMRFQLRVALLTAACAAAAQAVIVLLVPTPTLDTATRAQTAGWWALMLVFGAVLAGTLARLERDERDRLAATQARAATLGTIDHERREFLRVVAHELRTPTASLLALARRVAGDDEGLDDTQRRAALALISGHAEHLAAFERVLREVAGAQDLAAVDRPRPADSPLHDVVAQAVAAAVVAAGAAPESVIVRCEEARLRTDATRLRRIVTNLVDNALRYHGEEPVEVRAVVDGGWLHLLVADRGPGMSDTELALAFERYASFGQRRGASGLGLWIVHELTRSLGGEVRARTRHGGGLAVEVDLPVQPSATAAVTPADPPPAAVADQ